MNDRSKGHTTSENDGGVGVVTVDDVAVSVFPAS